MIFSNNFEQLAIVEVRRQPCFDKILLERPSAYVNRRRTMNDVSGQIKSILKRTSMPASSSLATLPLMSSASTTATSAPALVAVATASAVTATSSVQSAVIAPATASSTTPSALANSVAAVRTTSLVPAVVMNAMVTSPNQMIVPAVASTPPASQICIRRTYTPPAQKPTQCSQTAGYAKRNMPQK